MSRGFVVFWGEPFIKLKVGIKIKIVLFHMPQNFIKGRVHLGYVWISHLNLNKYNFISNEIYIIFESRI